MLRGGSDLIIAYLAFGLSLSAAQNLGGAVSGHLSAFVWTGSIVGNATLLFWWFLVPAVTWPVDLYCLLPQDRGEVRLRRGLVLRERRGRRSN